MKRWVGSRQCDEDEEVRPSLTAAGGRPEIGVLAARLALRAALANRPEAARAAGLVVITVPEESWVSPVAEAWREEVCEGRKAERLGAMRLFHPSRAGGWTSAPQEGRLSAPMEDVERALALGLAVVVIGHQSAWIPAAVAASADLSLALAPLSWRALRLAAMRSAGAPASCGMAEPSASILAAVTPRVLRLSSRPGGGAEGLLQRALRVAAAEAQPRSTTSATVRGLETIGGMHEAVAWGHRLAADLAAYREGSLAWADVDRGLLLSGPPGVGKTVFARALAVTCGVPFVAGSHGEWQAAGHQGEMLAAMRASFAKARASAPSIMFIDEVDSFPDRASVGHDHGSYVRQIVNGLLTELDGAASREGVVVIAACNDARAVDPAIARSGRLDRHLHIPLPSPSDLADILRVHLGGLLPGAALMRLGGLAGGMSGADCERLVREARATARRAGRPMTEADMEAAIGGPEDDRHPELLWRIAVHEAGHAVAHEAVAPGSLCEVSLRQRGNSGGRVVAAAPADEELTPSVLRVQIVGLLAGRAAEETVLGEPGAGGGLGGCSDLAQATRLAALAVATLGYDEEAGLLWQGLPPAGDAMARWLTMRPAIAARVRERLAEAQEEAHRVVGGRREAVLAVAEALLQRRTLTGEEVRSLPVWNATALRGGSHSLAA